LPPTEKKDNEKDKQKDRYLFIDDVNVLDHPQQNIDVKDAIYRLIVKLQDKKVKVIMLSSSS